MGLLSSVRTRLRRRRAVHRYLDELSRDLQEREIRLDDLEGALASERAGFHERIVAEVLERSEIILAELDRRIEEVGARTDRDLAALERRLVEVHEKVDRLRAVGGTSGNGDRPGEGRAPSTAEGAPPTSVAE
jgi:hypothetical protein